MCNFNNFADLDSTQFVYLPSVSVRTATGCGYFLYYLLLFNYTEIGDIQEAKWLIKSVGLVTGRIIYHKHSVGGKSIRNVKSFLSQKRSGIDLPRSLFFRLKEIDAFLGWEGD